jgi:hypothetical protein
VSTGSDLPGAVLPAAADPPMLIDLPSKEEEADMRQGGLLDILSPAAQAAVVETGVPVELTGGDPDLAKNLADEALHQLDQRIENVRALSDVDEEQASAMIAVMAAAAGGARLGLAGARYLGRSRGRLANFLLAMTGIAGGGTGAGAATAAFDPSQHIAETFGIDIETADRLVTTAGLGTMVAPTATRVAAGALGSRLLGPLAALIPTPANAGEAEELARLNAEIEANGGVMPQVPTPPPPAAPAAPAASSWFDDGLALVGNALGVDPNVPYRAPGAPAAPAAPAAAPSAPPLPAAATEVPPAATETVTPEEAVADARKNSRNEPNPAGVTTQAAAEDPALTGGPPMTFGGPVAPTAPPVMDFGRGPLPEFDVSTGRGNLDPYGAPETFRATDYPAWAEGVVNGEVEFAATPARTGGESGSLRREGEALEEVFRPNALQRLFGIDSQEDVEWTRQLGQALLGAGGAMIGGNVGRGLTTFAGTMMDFDDQRRKDARTDAATELEYAKLLREIDEDEEDDYYRAAKYELDIANTESMIANRELRRRELTTGERATARSIEFLTDPVNQKYLIDRATKLLGPELVQEALGADFAELSPEAQAQRVAVLAEQLAYEHNLKRATPEDEWSWMREPVE